MVAFSRSLEQALHRALAIATDRHQVSAGIEHLLLSLTDDQESVEALNACFANIDDLRRDLTVILIPFTTTKQSALFDNPKPTAAFQRIVQRAHNHGQDEQKEELTGPDLLIEMIIEQEQPAIKLLEGQG